MACHQNSNGHTHHLFSCNSCLLRWITQCTSSLARSRQNVQTFPFAFITQVRLPAALPAFASGFRIAVSVAPIGAVIGEWVGSSEGLGYLMIHANARMQVDLMFAALLILVAISLCLYFSIDWLLRRFIWHV